MTNSIEIRISAIIEEKTPAPKTLNIPIDFYFYEDEIYTREELEEYFDCHEFDNFDFDEWLSDNYAPSELFDVDEDEARNDFFNECFDNWMDSEVIRCTKEIKIVM